MSFQTKAPAKNTEQMPATPIRHSAGAIQRRGCGTRAASIALSTPTAIADMPGK